MTKDQFEQGKRLDEMITHLDEINNYFSLVKKEGGFINKSDCLLEMLNWRLLSEEAIDTIIQVICDDTLKQLDKYKKEFEGL